MPKPLLPRHGGPNYQAWAAQGSQDAVVTPRNRLALEAEIDRLRQELACLPENEYEADISVEKSRAVPMLWCTVGLCGAALLFAIFAILSHG